MGIGLDFGTTNSSLAVAVPNQTEVKLARFAVPGGLTESFRSLLYLERVREGGRSTTKSWSGPDGVERYLHADEKGRLVQSLKSFLASRSLLTTEILDAASAWRNSLPTFSATSVSKRKRNSVSPYAMWLWAVPSSLSAQNRAQTMTTPSDGWNWL